MQTLSYFSRPDADGLSGSAELDNIWNQLKKLRYDVFAKELQQYPENNQESLDDPGEHFLVLLEQETLIGYVSVNSPESEGFRITKYFGDEILDAVKSNFASKSVIYEVRGLTVNNEYRSRGVARLLMLGALKFIQSNGADAIIAMGHTSVLPMYEEIGMTILNNFQASAGDIVFYPMSASVSHLCELVETELSNIELTSVDYQDDACYHGGASWNESGFDFKRRNELIVADVLDSPFPPCPEVMEVISENLISSCHESPPTQCEPLIDKIAEVRQISKENVLVSSGSSSLMFSLLPQMINEESSVLVLSPMYGEYLHILTHLIRCHVTHFPLYPENGFVIDLTEFVNLARTHDAVIIVNPNSPTGVYNANLNSAVGDILDQENGESNCKMIWVDETYIEYVDDAVSLEKLTSRYDELIICKSMSKCYALSGLRVAYAVTANALRLRRFIPPWAVSLPAQLGAIAALSNPNYYLNQYMIVHENRNIFNEDLRKLGFTTYPSVANYILTQLPDSVTHSSNQFIALCREQDVFIRDAENMGVTLDSRYVRFAVRSRDENLRIISCLEKLLSEFT